MKITINKKKKCSENEIIIKCNEITDEVLGLQNAINSYSTKNMKMELVSEGKEYYVPVEEIIFFQTEGEFIKAHTRNDMFNTKHKLYELEQLLPHYFIRISKSAIVNSKEIYAITRNLTASSKIEFKDTYKHIFVSRGYYKPLKSKIEEMRNIR